MVERIIVIAYERLCQKDTHMWPNSCSTQIATFVKYFGFKGNDIDCDVKNEPGIVRSSLYLESRQCWQIFDTNSKEVETVWWLSEYLLLWLKEPLDGNSLLVTWYSVYFVEIKDIWRIITWIKSVILDKINVSEID